MAADGEEPGCCALCGGAVGPDERCTEYAWTRMPERVMPPLRFALTMVESPRLQLLIYADAEQDLFCWVSARSVVVTASSPTPVAAGSVRPYPEGDLTSRVSRYDLPPTSATLLFGRTPPGTGRTARRSGRSLTR